jgi:hypothetical protein
MVILGKDTETYAMDALDDETINLLDTFIKRMDRRLYIHKIDYQMGVIGLGYTYNIGTKDEWNNDDFMEVNVSCESVPCLMWEVVDKVYHKVVM